ncbi:MAG: ferredoxin [Planctomycetes bacterium]|nr:ferredoxin [Planctomycetota bacterium]
MKVDVDQEECTGCGLCADTCPDVFELGEETAAVIVDVVPEDLKEDARQAAEDCPVEAIKIVEE